MWSDHSGGFGFRGLISFGPAYLLIPSVLAFSNWNISLIGWFNLYVYRFALLAVLTDRQTSLVYTIPAELFQNEREKIGWHFTINTHTHSTFCTTRSRNKRRYVSPLYFIYFLFLPNPYYYILLVGSFVSHSALCPISFTMSHHSFWYYS